jgi:hypothetical protein
MRRGIAGELQPITRRARWRSAMVPLFIACIAATGGVVAWDSMRPQSNTLNSAVIAAQSVPANTNEANSVAARLRDCAVEAMRALRAMEDRGDQRAKFARNELLSQLQDECLHITVEQIRARLAGMDEAAFCVWLRTALK